MFIPQNSPIASLPNTHRHIPSMGTRRFHRPHGGGSEARPGWHRGGAPVLLPEGCLPSGACWPEAYQHTTIHSWHLQQCSEGPQHKCIRWTSMGRWAKAGPVIRGLLARHARSVNSDTGTRHSFALGAFNSHTAPLSKRTQCHARAN